MVLPFFLLLLGLLLVPFKSPVRGWQAFGASPAVVLLFAFLYALVLDVQYAMNTWNWPVSLALGAVALPLAGWAGRKAAPREAGLASLQGAGLWAVTALLGVGLMWPFRSHFARGVTQIGWVLPVERQLGSYIPAAFFTFGLAGLASLLPLRLTAWFQGHDKALGLRKLLRQKFSKLASKLPLRLQEKLPARFYLLCLWVLAGVVLGSASLAGLSRDGVLWTAGGLVLLCLGGFVLLTDSKEGGGEEAYVWVLAFCAMAVVAGSELRYVADRMNTIFKFWFQAWVLMGLVFGYGLHRTFSTAQAAAKPVRKSRKKKEGLDRPFLASLAAFPLGLLASAWLDLRSGGVMRASFLWILACLTALAVLGFWAKGGPVRRGLFLGLLASGLVYPLGATLGRTLICSGWRHPHLDGLAFMDSMMPRSLAADNGDYDRFDAAAIRWLNKNADKTEPILEAPGRDLYKGYSRFSIYTGLPTLIGWKYQVSQQLGQNAGSRIEDRDRDLSLIYSTPDVQAAQELLKRYRVRWIVVGGLERKLYPAEGLAKFNQFCTPAFSVGGTALYRYDQAKPL
jgi:uncharacterized membrane protein